MLLLLHVLHISFKQLKTTTIMRRLIYITLALLLFVVCYGNAVVSKGAAFGDDKNKCRIEQKKLKSYKKYCRQHKFHLAYYRQNRGMHQGSEVSTDNTHAAAVTVNPKFR
jgi:hypothetical protein